MVTKTLTRRHRRGGAPGFTLIELLLVMMIIAILAAVVVPKFTGQSEKARRSAALQDIATIKTQLESFEIQEGHYPSAEEGLQSLVTPPAPANGEAAPHPFLEKLPKDPWGQDYVYHFPGANGKDYDLYSKGPDMQDGTPDDIGDTNRQ
jgi:general secretion pathway protein G